MINCIQIVEVVIYHTEKAAIDYIKNGKLLEVFKQGI